jgi:hypothetical protein
MKIMLMLIADGESDDVFFLVGVLVKITGLLSHGPLIPDRTFDHTVNQWTYVKNVSSLGALAAEKYECKLGLIVFVWGNIKCKN